MSEELPPGSGAPVPSFPTYDGNGNITAWVNASGTVIARQRYDAYGNVVEQTGTPPSNYGFSTKPQDQVTGLLYYGYRHYDPVTGRWPSRDPIEEEGGINLYGFVGNDGVNQLDILGLTERSDSGRLLDFNADAPERKCFRPYIRFGSDLFGGQHPNEGLGAKMNPGHKYKKHYLDEIKKDMRSAPHGSITVGLERINSDECKDTECKYAVAGIEEYAYDNHNPKGGTVTISGTFRDNILGDDPMSKVFSKQFQITRYEHINENGHSQWWYKGIQGFIYAYDMKARKKICQKTFNIINPYRAK
jgi:RHS repeat-associated protein